MLGSSTDGGVSMLGSSTDGVSVLGSSTDGVRYRTNTESGKVGVIRDLIIVRIVVIL